MIKRPGIYENAEMRQNWLIRRFEDLKLLLKGVRNVMESGRYTLKGTTAPLTPVPAIGIFRADLT